MYRLFYGLLSKRDFFSALLSAGQYFDIKIEYVDITAEEFNRRMADYRSKLTEMFAESHRLETEILAQLDTLHFNEQ